MAVALVGLSGLIGAELQARQQPRAAPGPNVLILDITRTVEPLAADLTLSDEQRVERARALSAALGEAVAAQVAAGTIVLDAAAVYAAPDHAYVRP